MKTIIFRRRKSTQIVDQLSSKQITTIRRELLVRMARQYSTSQGFFHSKIINNIIQKKEGDKNCIKVNDIRHDDQKQYMQTYYKLKEINQQLPELLQYYKYYSQDSICFLSREFSFLAVHHQKKKAVIYERLKKQLNISNSENSLAQIVKSKSPKKFQNVLSSLLNDTNNDQSYFVSEMLKKLVNYYGPSSLKTIKKIDSQFNFGVSNRPILNNRFINTLQNTNNFSTKNQEFDTLRKSNILLKRKSNKNLLHKRFDSCQLPKSAKVRLSILNNSNINNQYDFKRPNNIFKEGKDKKRNQQRRRRKSAQNICRYDSNLIQKNYQNYKNVTLKTQQPQKNSDQKANKTILGQKIFRNKIQQIRGKIRQEKQNITKKQQDTCFTKKKYKKL